MNKVLFELFYVVFFTFKYVGILLAAFVILMAASMAFDHFAGLSSIL